MSWMEIMGWVGVFLMGCYAGSKYEMSRMVNAAEKDLLFFVRNKAYKVRQTLPPG